MGLRYGVGVEGGQGRAPARQGLKVRAGSKAGRDRALAAGKAERAGRRSPDFTGHAACLWLLHRR